MATKPTSPHVLIELTCPHCEKKNSVAVAKVPAGNKYYKSKVSCAYCGKPWDALLQGPIFAGPFPK